MHKLTPEEIHALMTDEKLRLFDHPHLCEIAELLIINPDDIPLLELFLESLEVANQIAVVRNSEDVFYKNLPPKDFPFASNGIRLGKLTDTQNLILPSTDLRKGLMVTGSSGSGKTTMMTSIILSALRGDPPVSFLVIDRKGDFGDCTTFKSQVPVLRLHASELKLPLLVPPQGMLPESHVSHLIEFLKLHLDIMWSAKILTITLDGMYKHSLTGWTLKHWILALKKFESEQNIRTFKILERIETALTALESLERSLGKILNYTTTRVIDNLLDKSGVTILDCSDLNDHDASFIAGSIYYRAFHERRLNESKRKKCLAIVIDDALKIVAQPFERQESPAGEWARLARAYNLCMVVLSQNYSSIDESVRNNLDTLVCLKAWGNDSKDIARDMGLDEEQGIALGCLKQNEAVVMARSVLDRPVKVTFEKLP